MARRIARQPELAARNTRRAVRPWGSCWALSVHCTVTGPDLFFFGPNLNLPNCTKREHSATLADGRIVRRKRSWKILARNAPPRPLASL